MIGIIGINGKMGSYFANELNRDDIVGYDLNKHSKYKTYDNYNFFDNDLELVIDFSNSSLAKDILLECVNRKIKVISGTSNIPNIDIISKTAYSNKVSFVYLENFSKGINDLSKIINHFNTNEIEIVEEHNVNKNDISQTAITIANFLNVNSINKIRTIKKQSNHYLKFYYEGEEIEIIHKCLDYSAYKEIFFHHFEKILSSDFYYICGII